MKILSIIDFRQSSVAEMPGFCYSGFTYFRNSFHPLLYSKTYLVALTHMMYNIASSLLGDYS